MHPNANVKDLDNVFGSKSVNKSTIISNCINLAERQTLNQSMDYSILSGMPRDLQF